MNRNLIKLFSTGDIGTVQTLVQAEPLVSIRVLSSNGETPLHFAARHGRTQLCDLLLSEGADSEQESRDGKRALHEAVSHAHFDTVAFLLDHGAHVDPLKRSDWTPLMMACAKATPLHLEIVELLLTNGAQATLANKDGWSPLHIAARQGFSPLVALLLHHGPEMVHHRSKNGRLPIHTAAQHGHMEVVQLLLHHSPQSLLAQDKAGTSVLMCACVGNHPAMVSHLLACKPTPSLATRDAAGLTPLDIATRLGFDSLCRVLLDAGSDPSNSERRQ